MNDELSGNLFSLNEDESNAEGDIEVEVSQSSEEDTQQDESEQISEQKAPEAPTQDDNLTFKQQVEKQRQRNKNPYKDRISNLTHSNKALQAKLAEKERILAQREQELQKHASLNDKLYASSLQSEEQAVLHKLKSAKEDGDIDTEIKLSQDLARIKSEQTAAGMMRKPQPVQNQNYEVEESVDDDFEDRAYQESPYAQTQQPNIEDVPEAYLNFLEKNAWADQNSPSYDPELWTEANEFAKNLNKRLKFNNQAHLIGTDAYYDSLENYMNAEYGMNTLQQSQEEAPVQHKSQSAPIVGGVNRAGASMADQYAHTSSKARPVVTLTPQEYRIARNLQIPHPSGHGYLTSEEAIKKYAENKAYYARQKPDPRYSVRM